MQAEFVCACCGKKCTKVNPHPRKYCIDCSRSKKQKYVDEYQKKHQRKIRKYQEKYRTDNKDRILELQRSWREAHRDYWRAYNHVRLVDAATKVIPCPGLEDEGE